MFEYLASARAPVASPTGYTLLGGKRPLRMDGTGRYGAVGSA